MSFALEALAFTVASIAAYYAKCAVKEAKGQNDIAQFEKRLSIYHRLGKFRVVVTTGGPSYPEEAIWEFENAVQLSEFYFPAEIYNEFTRIGKIALKNRSLLDSSGATPTSYSLSGPSPFQKSVKANNELRDDCVALSKIVRLHLAMLSGQTS